jgi:hypothetical protein
VGVGSLSLSSSVFVGRLEDGGMVVVGVEWSGVEWVSGNGWSIFSSLAVVCLFDRSVD